MFGVGIHQHNTAGLITGALAFQGTFGDKIDELLIRYGFDFDGKEEDTRLYIRNSYDAARAHNNKFFDIAFGNGNMSDFAKDFADILEESLAGKGFEAELAPILNICRNGMTDTKVNRLLFPALTDIQNHQSNFNADIFTNTAQSNAMLFADKLKTAT